MIINIFFFRVPFAQRPSRFTLTQPETLTQAKTPTYQQHEKRNIFLTKINFLADIHIFSFLIGSLNQRGRYYSPFNYPIHLELMNKANKINKLSLKIEVAHVRHFINLSN
ncbi:hypothetical protein [Gallibacterium anatis]|uniref:hypothetical protein n=1 Tax=Gallibacterium anatis TaxID=750 RepID=UPI0030072767